MTTEVIAQSITAALGADFGQGSTLYIKTAASPLTIIGRRRRTGAQPVKLTNVGAGLKFRTTDRWETLRVTTTVDQNIELIISDDDVDVANAVSVSGVASVSMVGPATLNASTSQVLATANAIARAQNLNRKSITVSNYTGSTGSVFIQSTAAGASKGTELQVGQSVQITGTYAFDVRNDSGGNCTIGFYEEQ